MTPSRLAAITAAAIALAGCGSAPAVTAHHHRPARVQDLSARRTAPQDPSLSWLASPGGQAQVVFSQDVDSLAAALETDNHAAFESDARAVRAEAREILRTPLLPRSGRAGYERMLRDFTTVADLLQPGPGYGTTAQDVQAWDVALSASDVTVGD